MDVVDISLETDMVCDQNSIMGKLLTKPHFSKNRLMATLRSVWRVSKDVQILSLEDNLFMFKFVTLTDKQRVFYGSPLAYDRQHLLLQEYDVDKSLSV